MATPRGTLINLLAESKRLLQSFDQNPNVEPLSLRQISLIHEVFLDGHRYQTWESGMIQRVLRQSDGMEGVIISELGSDGANHRALMVCQFLLRWNKSQNGPWNALLEVGLPLLLYEGDTGNEAVCRAEVRDAFLECVFLPFRERQKGAENCATFCWFVVRQGLKGELNADRLEMVCRILVRLLDCAIDHEKEIVLQYMHKVVLGTMHAVVGTSPKDDQEGFAKHPPSLVKPVTALLLPKLYPDASSSNPNLQERAKEFCAALLPILRPPFSDITISSLVMGVLCIALPTFLDVQALPLSDLHSSILSSLSQSGSGEWVSKTGSRSSPEENSYQMLRRRAIHVFRLSLQKYPDPTWNKYVSCFEALEMEHELHLVDQIWPTVAEFCSLLTTSDHKSYPIMSWKWIGALLARIFFSEIPTIRKLAMYRFLNGNAGVCTLVQFSPTEENYNVNIRSKHKRTIQYMEMTPTVPIHLVEEDFIFRVLIPSHDSLSGSIGHIMQFERNGKVCSDNVLLRFVSFLENYVLALGEFTSRQESVLKVIMSEECLCNLRPKTISLLFEALARAAEKSPLQFSNEAVENAIISLPKLFKGGGVVPALRAGILSRLACLLRYGNCTPDFEVVLKTLQLYPILPEEATKEEIQVSNTRKYMAYQNQLSRAALREFLNHFPWVESEVPNILQRYVRKQFPEDMAGAIVKLVALGTCYPSEILLEVICQAIRDGNMERGLALLEYGCLEKIILEQKVSATGLSNKEMEELLTLCFRHLINEISEIELRNETTHQIYTRITQLLRRIHTIQSTFPSSRAIPTVSDQYLQSTLDEEITVQNALTSYACLSCNPDTASSSPLYIFDKILSLQVEQQQMKSLFQHAKWGILSILLPQFSVKEFHEMVYQMALDEIHATPTDGIYPLFQCVLSAGQHLPVQRVIEGLFTAMNEMKNSTLRHKMLNQICTLLFTRPNLDAEYHNFRNGKDTPIRKAFRDLINMAGIKKPYIAHTVLARICPVWLGSDGNGECAILYRKDIVSLLVYKEARIDVASSHQQMEGDEVEEVDPPPPAHETSLGRAFVLHFLTKLPPSESISRTTLKELLHYIILSLLQNYCLSQPQCSTSLMLGSKLYSQKIRSYQALCILYPYVTSDIAPEVCNLVFQAMQYPTHGQIRYFMEVFVIQCSILHPSVFVNKFVTEIKRYDLSLQHIASLMIIGGNLIVNHKFEYLTREKNIREVLAGVLPWLGSTQGFTRAIAQLLAYRLIPLLPIDDGSHLHAIHAFLDQNNEMKRLRSKQMNFFEEYNVGEICTLEGILKIPTDSGDEANPPHLVDEIKKSLEEVYEEAREGDAPVWKQVKELMEEKESQKKDQEGTKDDDEEEEEEEMELSFQRKILPLNSLQLALQEHRNSKSKNAAGNIKRKMIVCATFIDKVPNLAGLARTCEIFALEKLVIPDNNVRKMDIFKSVSVGADEWIEIEECKEQDLLQWLANRKRENYAIVGLEQTSSSASITKFSFPERTVLLLGKEKEGIPVEFLQLVDTCLEIPQQGIIRSLNVHVTGAIAIWEYSKQKMTMETIAS